MNAQVAITQILIEQNEADIGQLDRSVARLIAHATVELARLAELVDVGYEENWYWQQSQLLAGGLAGSALARPAADWNVLANIEGMAERIGKLGVWVYALAEMLHVELPFVSVQAARGGSHES